MLIRKITVGRDDVRLIKCRQFEIYRNKHSSMFSCHVFLKIGQCLEWRKSNDVKSVRGKDLVETPQGDKQAKASRDSLSALVGECSGFLHLQSLPTCVYVVSCISFKFARWSKQCFSTCIFLPSQITYYSCAKSKCPSQWIGFPISMDLFLHHPIIQQHNFGRPSAEINFDLSRDSFEASTSTHSSLLGQWRH